MKTPHRTKEITVHLENICHSDHTTQCTATSNAPTLHARWKRKNRIARLKHTIARQHHIIKALKQENALYRVVAPKHQKHISKLEVENILLQGQINKMKDFIDHLFKSATDPKQ